MSALLRCTCIINCPGSVSTSTENFTIYAKVSCDIDSLLVSLTLRRARQVIYVQLPGTTSSTSIISFLFGTFFQYNNYKESTEVTFYLYTRLYRYKKGKLIPRSPAGLLVR